MNNSDKSGRAGRPVRVEDVAREAGVSPITVSRALSAPHKVRQETRERVMEAVARTGYVVNSIASSLRSGRSSIVTIFVASLLNPHFAAAMQGALDAFEGSRFRLMFAQTGYVDGLKAEVLELIRPFNPAAVMFAGIPMQPEARAALRKVGIPIMEMWSGADDPIDMVAGASIETGAAMMGRHFAEQGYKHIAYVGQTKVPGGIGMAGFRRGLEEAGSKLEFVLAVEGTGTLSAGIAAFDRLLDEFPSCDAVYIGSDLLAVGAQIAAGDRGLQLPRDMAMGGYGDLEFARYLRPALTTVAVSDYETGRLAGVALRHRLENGEHEPIIQVPMRLLVRDSTPKRARKT
ncbi:MAG: LacI family transcriptional regulator [Hyphomicrobiales bacterium]|nr:MAG: LacI family transcriptional regulator [Hyphomicrobiales bacterium]